MQIYNTLSGQKEIFKPLKKGKVSMYVCGVTVYDDCHIGHARAYVAFDCIRSVFQYFGYDVTYVQNFTDIDDKIINQALEEKIPFDEVAKKYTKSYYEDMDALEVQRADLYPTVSENIENIIKFIQKIIDKKSAYVKNGNVYFDISSYKEYGQLSKRDTEQLEAGARVEVIEEKQNPLDFALWKIAKEGEPSWDSPWGKGRPGWHIECSVMGYENLGKQFDIHGGGRDLIFPHHENEIAQSIAHNKKIPARYWLHNGFVNINQEKMSKSLGNVFLLKDMFKKYDPMVVRYFLLHSQYRSPIDFSEQGIHDAQVGYNRLCEVMEIETKEIDDTKEIEKFKNEFEEFLADDCNSAGVIAVINEVIKYCNSTKSKNAQELIQTIIDVLGIKTQSTEIKLTDEQKRLLEERAQARKNKDFKKSDEIRDQFLQQGLIIKDTPQGQEVKKS
ncbi:cysteine--tRNA ligase [Candidatus Margulisiibacteriota bacterium]